MQKEFCSYEQALALKELGFYEHCMGFYYYAVPELRWVLQISSDYHKIVSIIDAPLKQQVFRWFREKYEFCYHIFSLKITASDKTGYRYSWEIYNHTPEWIAEDNSLLGSLTYEEAENNAINKLIELAKQKEK